MIELDAPIPEHNTERNAVAGLEGRLARGGLVALLRWASGWALLGWAGRLLLSAVGFRREARIALSDGWLEIQRRTLFWGRVISETEERRSLRSLLSAGRQVRYPALHLVVGIFSLACGVLLGGFFAWDAFRVGDRILLAMASVVFLGAGLDLALDILVPGRSGRVALDIRVEQGRGLRLIGVALDDADRFLTALAESVRRLDTTKGAT